MTAWTAEDEAFFGKRPDAATLARMFGREKHPADRPTLAGGAFTEVGLPPCMSAIAQELTAGGNPGHAARFALACFLVKRQVPETEAKAYFAGAVNYREDVTREQLRGIYERGYAPYGCDKMRSLGLCRQDDECVSRCLVTPMGYPRRAS